MAGAPRPPVLVVLAAQEQMAEICFNLVRDFGGRIRPIAVGYLSPRGLWLSLVHRLGRENAVVVGGRAVIPAREGYPAVRAAVARALAG